MLQKLAIKYPTQPLTFPLINLMATESSVNSLLGLVGSIENWTDQVNWFDLTKDWTVRIEPHVLYAKYN